MTVNKTRMLYTEALISLLMALHLSNIPPIAKVTKANLLLSIFNTKYKEPLVADLENYASKFMAMLNQLESWTQEYVNTTPEDQFNEDKYVTDLADQLKILVAIHMGAVNDESDTFE